MITLTFDAKCQSVLFPKKKKKALWADFITISWTTFPRGAVSQNAKKRPNFHRDRNLRPSARRPASGSDGISLQNNRVLSMIYKTTDISGVRYPKKRSEGGKK